MPSYILTGMQFGDEGKGSFVDWLTNKENIDCIVRFNGGSHASHSVISSEGSFHKFGQLGSGMLRKSCHTFFTEDKVLDLDALIYEVDIFSKEIGISKDDVIQRIHIHEECYMVTQYHRLMNLIREFALGKFRRGTAATGVSEVKKILLETNGQLGIKVKEFLLPDGLKVVKEKYKRLKEYVFEFYRNNYKTIWANIPEDMEYELKKWIVYLNGDASAEYEANELVSKFTSNRFNLSKCIYFDDSAFLERYDKILYEGAQGFLIDYEYGTKPYTSFLDATINGAVKKIRKQDEIKKIGIAKAFCTRHSSGPFPTYVKNMNEKISDENQIDSYWSGPMRFGWFDAVLFRYAQSVNKVDAIFLSSLDSLSCFKYIKICNEYVYKGKIDAEFERVFQYYIDSSDKVIITDIINPSESLGKYLRRCTPRYIILNGWNSNIENVTKKEELPEDCLMYIKMIEIITSTKISVVSVGPTRDNKIIM